MKMTLIIRDELMAHAIKLTHIKEKTALVHAGLQALIEKTASAQLAEMAGFDPSAKVPSRRYPTFK